MGGTPQPAFYPQNTRNTRKKDKKYGMLGLFLMPLLFVCDSRLSVIRGVHLGGGLHVACIQVMQLEATAQVDSSNRQS